MDCTSVITADDAMVIMCHFSSLQFCLFCSFVVSVVSNIQSYV